VFLEISRIFLGDETPIRLSCKTSSLGSVCISNISECDTTDCGGEVPGLKSVETKLHINS